MHREKPLELIDSPKIIAKPRRHCIGIRLVAPFRGITLVVGLIASLIQSVTSLQEPTLSFAPKLLALAGAMLILTPWLLRTLSEFTISFITRMGTMAH